MTDPPVPSAAPEATVGKRVLVVEDDPEIARLVEIHLSDLGCVVELASDGDRGWEKARTGTFDLVVLDLMLPGLDGLEICRRLRALETYPPVLMLTARSGEVDRVVGLETGADDYLTKPFSVRELAARVKALLRRAGMRAESVEGGAARRLRVHGLDLDPVRRRVEVEGREVHLTAREFDLLYEFARHPGRVFTRSQLLDRVWGYGHDGYEHTVNSHINRLRGKIEEDPAAPRHVLTVWGVGYKLAEP